MHPRRPRLLVAAVGGALALGAVTGCSQWWSSSTLQSHPPPVPGGSRIAFVAAASRARDSLTNVVSVLPSGAGLTSVTRGGPSVTDAAWSARTGGLVYARRWEGEGAGEKVAGRAGIFVQESDGTTHLIRRCPLRCWASSFAWSPDGRQIAFVTRASSDTEIAVMNTDGSGFRVICAETRCGQGLDDPQWSPDGSRLLFSNQGVLGFIGVGILPSGIWVANADGSGIRKLTQPNCRPGAPGLVRCAFDSQARWSPDGRSIAFSRHPSIPLRPGHPNLRTSIELMATDGSHLHPIYTCTGVLCAQAMTPSWAPDGSRLAIAPWVERRPRIIVLTTTGKSSEIRTCAGTRCVTPDDIGWEPDGRSLAFISTARDSDAYVIGDTGMGMHRIGLHARCCLTWLGH